jgi:hypothetical protein
MGTQDIWMEVFGLREYRRVSWVPYQVMKELGQSDRSQGVTEQGNVTFIIRQQSTE